DVASTVVLGALVLVLVTGILVFAGGDFAEDLFGFVGLGPDRGRRVEHRPLAGRAARGDARLPGHLLQHARRHAPLVAMDDARRRGRRAALAARVVVLLDLHLQGGR